MFGPGMNGDVALGDDNNSADTLRIELVHDSLNHRGTALLRCTHDRFPYESGIIQTMAFTTSQFNQEVLSKSLHSYRQSSFN